MGVLNLKIPQVRGLAFYPQSIEKGGRSEKVLKLAVAEMYLKEVSTRRVESITQILCGLDFTSMQVSRAAKEIKQHSPFTLTNTISCLVVNAFKEFLLGRSQSGF